MWWASCSTFLNHGKAGTAIHERVGRADTLAAPGLLDYEINSAASGLARDRRGDKLKITGRRAPASHAASAGPGCLPRPARHLATGARGAHVGPASVPTEHAPARNNRKRRGPPAGPSTPVPRSATECAHHRDQHQDPSQAGSCQDRTVRPPPIASSKMVAFHRRRRGSDRSLMEGHARLSTGCPLKPIAYAWLDSPR